MQNFKHYLDIKTLQLNYNKIRFLNTNLPTLNTIDPNIKYKEKLKDFNFQQVWGPCYNVGHPLN